MKWLLACAWLLVVAPAAAQQAQRPLVVPFDTVSREAQSYWLGEA